MPSFLTLLAQADKKPGGLLGEPWIMMVIMVVMFYFLLIRPQRKAAKRHQEVLAALKRGDQVMTEGGILGEVIHLADDRITIKSAEARIIVARGKISRVINVTEQAAAS